MRAHLFPNLAWSSMIIFSSSGLNDPFFRFGRRWFAHRRRQLFPHRNKPEFFCTAFQLPSPCFLTYSVKIASSVVVHGPFFIPLTFVSVTLVSPPPSISYGRRRPSDQGGNRGGFSLSVTWYIRCLCVCIYICIYKYFSVCYESRYIEKGSKGELSFWECLVYIWRWYYFCINYYYVIMCCYYVLYLNINAFFCLFLSSLWSLNREKTEDSRNYTRSWEKDRISTLCLWPIGDKTKIRCDVVMMRSSF